MSEINWDNDGEVLEQTDEFVRIKMPFFDGYVIITEYTEEEFYSYKQYSDGTRVSTHIEDDVIVTRFANDSGTVFEYTDGSTSYIA